MQYGIISNTSTHQFYQNQRPVNCYPTTMSTSRTQVQTYQNKRRYHSGMRMVCVSEAVYLFIHFRNGSYR